MKAPPSTAAVAGPATPMLSPAVQVEVPFAGSTGAEDVSMPAPALTVLQQLLLLLMMRLEMMR